LCECSRWRQKSDQQCHAGSKELIAENISYRDPFRASRIHAMRPRLIHFMPDIIPAAMNFGPVFNSERRA
jgi:hypothetical protein